jgi:hypothetical protein
MSNPRRIAARLLERVVIESTSSDGQTATVRLLSSDAMLSVRHDDARTAELGARGWLLHGVHFSEPILVVSTYGRMDHLAAHVAFSFHFFMALHGAPVETTVQRGFFSSPGFPRALAFWNGIDDSGTVSSEQADFMLCLVTTSPLPSIEELHVTGCGEPAFDRFVAHLTAAGSLRTSSLQATIRNLAIACCDASNLSSTSEMVQTIQTGAFRAVLQLLWFVYSRVLVHLWRGRTNLSHSPWDKYPNPKGASACGVTAAAHCAVLPQREALRMLEVLLPSPRSDRVLADVSEVLTPLTSPARGHLALVAPHELSRVQSAWPSETTALDKLFEQRLHATQCFFRAEGIAEISLSFVLPAALLHPTSDAVRAKALSWLRPIGASMTIRDRAAPPDPQRSPPSVVIEIVGMPMLLVELGNACVELRRVIFTVSPEPVPLMTRPGVSYVLPQAFRRAPMTFCQYIATFASKLDALGLCHAQASAAIACHVFHADSWSLLEAMLLAVFSSFRQLSARAREWYLDEIAHLRRTEIRASLVRLHEQMCRIHTLTPSRDYMLFMQTLGSTDVGKLLDELDVLCDPEVHRHSTASGLPSTRLSSAQLHANRWMRMRQLVASLRVDVVQWSALGPPNQWGCSGVPASLTIGIIDESTVDDPLARFRAVRLFANLCHAHTSSRCVVGSVAPRLCDQMLALCHARSRIELAAMGERYVLDAVIAPRDPFPAYALPVLNSEQWALVLLDAAEGPVFRLAQVLSRVYSDDLRVILGQARLHGCDWDPLDALSLVIDMWMPHTLRQSLAGHTVTWVEATSRLLYEQVDSDRLHRWLFPEQPGTADEDFRSLVCALLALQTTATHYRIEEPSMNSQTYGAALHAHVSAQEPCRAHKLTGMLLELEEEEIEDLLRDPAECTLWVTEAMQVLRAAPEIFNKTSAGYRSYLELRLDVPNVA